MRQVDVLMFAAARQVASTDVLRVELDWPATADEVLGAIGRRCPQLVPLLPACRLAVDQRFASPDELVPDGTELALIPPVSGG